MSKSISILITIALAALFSAPAIATGPSAVDYTQAMPSGAGERTDGTREVSWRKLRTRFIAGDSLGMVRTEASCSKSTERDWSDLIAQRVEADLHDVFREQLAYSGLANAGQAESIEVAPFVSDLRIDLCSLGRAGWHGDIVVQISWTVSTASPRRVVYQASTSGTMKQLHPADGSAIKGLRGALTLAVQELFNDGRFVEMLAHPVGPTIVAAPR